MIAKFVEVWTSLVSFIVDTFESVTPLFYNTDTGLTFIGVMAVIMGGVSLILLVWNLIRSFFAMHG